MLNSRICGKKTVFRVKYNTIIRKITPMKMKAVIATDSISLRSRKMLLTFECPQDILINRSRPVHEATGGHAVCGNYCMHYIWVILRIIVKI